MNIDNTNVNLNMLKIIETLILIDTCSNNYKHI